MTSQPLKSAVPSPPFLGGNGSGVAVNQLAGCWRMKFAELAAAILYQQLRRTRASH